jgi:3-dehydroquinate dehydratase-2
MKILVVHGPNLNLLGTREPGVYGSATLAEIERGLRRAAAARGVEIAFVQSNHEGDLIDAVQAAPGTVDGVLVNAGGLTHTSVALRDALAAGPPAVEVHLSNIFGRESFRRRSLLAGACVGIVAGFGAASYRLGLEGLLDWLDGAEDTDGRDPAA